MSEDMTAAEGQEYVRKLISEQTAEDYERRMHILRAALCDAWSECARWQLALAAKSSPPYQGYTEEHLKTLRSLAGRQA